MIGAPENHAICNGFYGSFSDPRDCRNAINKLPTGFREVPWAVDQGSGPGHLPTSTQSGDCMIQIEIAGPRVPKTFEVVPDQLRAMAAYLLDDACHKEGSYGGGFITGDLNPMTQWLISPEGDLDRPMPLSTAFLTLSVTTPFSEYISPGNYDSQMAYLFFQEEREAATKLPPASRAAAKLRARGRRLLKQQAVMQPRGRRIPWWGNPDGQPNLAQDKPRGNATQDALQGPGGLAVVESLGFSVPEGLGGAAAAGGNGGTGTTATARKEKRMRRLAGRREKGSMA
ncbi:MAG: hypothetical protein Q9200_001423 [Gallowayella weberi]